jgi:hypothetical protein
MKVADMIAENPEIHCHVQTARNRTDASDRRVHQSSSPQHQGLKVYIISLLSSLFPSSHHSNYLGGTSKLEHGNPMTVRLVPKRSRHALCPSLSPRNKGKIDKEDFQCRNQARLQRKRQQPICSFPAPSVQHLHLKASDLRLTACRKRQR